jgi:hypothetical protein
MIKKNKFQIIELGFRDCDQIAKVHMDAFPESIFTIIGKSCVLKYYQWQFSEISRYDKLIYSYGIVNKNKLSAYTIFGKPRIALYGFIRNNKWFLFTKTIKLLPLFNLYHLKTILYGFKFYLKKKMFKSNNSNKNMVIFDDDRIGILITATSKDDDGRGFGTALMKKAEKVGKSDGFKYITLSVRSENINAIKIYQIHGYKKVIDKSGNWLNNEMIKQIN